MDVGQWQQHDSDVHPEPDHAIASPGDFNLLMQDLGDDFDGLLALDADTTMGNTAGDASAAAAAAPAPAPADQDNNRPGETQSDQRMAARGGINRKRHHRDQIRQLEAAFRLNQHPDDTQRANIGMRIGMAAQQVKFWFQNRRSARKTQDQKQELKELREEHQALQDERRALLLAIQSRTCLTCRGGQTAPAGPGERQHLLCENVRLQEELRRANANLEKVSGGRAVQAMPAAVPWATNDNVVVGAGKAVATADHAPSTHRALTAAGPTMPANEEDIARRQRETNKMLVHIAAHATKEFTALACSGAPMWIPNPEGDVELLNFSTYVDTMFPSIFGPYRTGYAVDASRKAGDVMCSADNLVAVLMDASSWWGVFPGIVASASASPVVTPGASPHGMIILMDAVLRVLSPRVPIRKVKFVRQCWKVEPGKWAVVDASVDGFLGKDGAGGGAPPEAYAASRLLPSGCLIEERNNSYCKVTWIMNMEYEETPELEQYHAFLRSGQALGACRWLASLQKQCDYVVLMHSHLNNGDITPDGRMNIFDLAQRMTRSFYEAVCGPWSQPWRSLGEWSNCGVGDERFKTVMRAVTFTVGGGAPMEQAGVVVLNVIVPVRLPGIPPQQVFNYLCDENRRGEWDILANGAPVLREGNYATGLLPGNAVSVLRTIASGRSSSKAILQETCADTSCMVLAYATMDEEYMLEHAMNNGGLASLSLLPSGVVILPDGASPSSDACSSSTASNPGALVSVMYQTPLNGQPPVQPSLEVVNNVGNLLCHAIRKIQDAVYANSVEIA